MNVEISPRRSGRTTRIIDQAVQCLFNNGSVILVDHHFDDLNKSMDKPREANRRATRYAFDILIGRLSTEHGSLKQFEIDKENFTVKLIQSEKEIAAYETNSQNNARHPEGIENRKVSY